jgi:hypothetical protein
MTQTPVDQLLNQIVIALREERVPELVEPPLVAAATNIGGTGPRTVAKPGSIQARTRRPLWIAGVMLAALTMMVVASPMIMPGARQDTAFAEVQEAVSAFKSVRYRILDFHGKKDPYITTTVVVRGVGSYAEGPDGSESITNLKARRMLTLDHRVRKATFYQLYLDDSSTPLDVLHEKLRNLPSDAQELGTAELDGKKILQFEFMNAGRFLVAVTPETKLPIRMELTLDGARSGGTPFREVITDFLFDAPVNESRFDLTVPAGYAVERCEEPRDRKPMDTKSLVVSPTRGIGPVPIGASKEQVIKAFGQPDWTELQGRFARTYLAPAKPAGNGRDDVVLERLHYNSLGFELSVSSATGVTQFRCLDLFPIARPFLGKTDAGIALGASLDDVVRAYGAPERRSGLREEVLDYLREGWSFIFRDGKLARFYTSQPISDQFEIEVHKDGSYSQRLKDETQ